MDRVTIRMPAEQVEAIERLVETGDYANRSELIRSCVDELLEQELCGYKKGPAYPLRGPD